MKKACAAKVRLELEWNDATGACGRIATSLVDNQNTLPVDQCESLNKKLDIVRYLSDKLKKDLDSHLLTHGCATACYQQIADVLDDVAGTHKLLAELFDTLARRHAHFKMGIRLKCPSETERSATRFCPMCRLSPSA